MKCNHFRFQRFSCTILVLLLLTAAFTGCSTSSSGSQADSVPESAARSVIEDNLGDNRTIYPYVVHTPSATWYLAAADIKLLGEETYYDGLYMILENQEQDFADVREYLKGFIPEEIPSVDIYTDFCGDASLSETAGAYYNRQRNFIKLFSNWRVASSSLLHEYVHYLSYHCIEKPVAQGLYGEGLAEYVANIACKNRMSRSIQIASFYSAEEVAFMKSHGFWDEAEGCADLQKYYYGYARQVAQGILVGEMYFSVKDIMEERTEAVQNHPTVWNVSHYEAACILAYLIDTDSKDAVFRKLSTNPEDFESVFGEPFSEIYRKWTVWNAEKCAELGVD